MTLSNKRLLLIDDDSDDRILFIDALAELDDSIECITAVNGQHALDILAELDRLPAFIFLDLNMPRFNGKKCLAELKKDVRYKDIPVIIYTTSKEVEESKMLREMGAFYFITKPKNA